MTSLNEKITAELLATLAGKSQEIAVRAIEVAAIADELFSRHHDELASKLEVDLEQSDTAA